MPSSTYKISIVIPLYNEEETIKNTLERIPEFKNYEIIVVDDGSKDNSIEEVKKISPYKKVKLIQHRKNKGYGHALLTGINESDGDIIVTMDSDGQHNPEEINNLIKPLPKDEADIVIGSRYFGKSSYNIPLYTRLGEIVIENWINLLYHQKISNNQSGFRAFKRETLDIFDKMIYKGMAFTTEILFKSAAKGYKIKEIPISLNARSYGTSYVNIIRVLKSIIVCGLVYTLKKKNLDINKLFLKKLLDYFYKKIRHLKVLS